MTGTATSPACQMAYSASRYSGRLRITMATRSPGERPRSSRRPAAPPAVRAASSRHVAWTRSTLGQRRIVGPRPAVTLHPESRVHGANVAPCGSALVVAVADRRDVRRVLRQPVGREVCRPMGVRVRDRRGRRERPRAPARDQRHDHPADDREDAEHRTEQRVPTASNRSTTRPRCRPRPTRRTPTRQCHSLVRPYWRARGRHRRQPLRPVGTSPVPVPVPVRPSAAGGGA